MELSGRLLGNRYELLSLLAGGGMGQVWRGRDTLLRRPVAVKVLRPEVSSDPAFLARFRAEAQHTAGLTHANIAAVYDYGELPGEGGDYRAYLVMELVEGEPLSDLLTREGRLGVPLTLSILRQVAAALAAAHAAGVVHRDIKPGNVLVARDGLVKITDFGIASSATSVPLTRTGQVIGTAHYLSPEQAQGGKASPASDVYAAGAVAYECLAGRRAFDGDNPVQVVVRHIREVPAPLPPDVPPPVRALVDHAMAKDPAERIPDGAALRTAVEQVMAEVAPGPNAQPTVTTTVPLPLPDRKRPANATAVLPFAGVADAGGTSVAPPPDPAESLEPGEGGHGSRRLLVAVVAVALVLAAAVIAAVLHGNGGSPSAGSSAVSSSVSSPSVPAWSTSATAAPTTPVPTATAARTSQSAPPAIRLAAGDLIGRPADEVKARLTALGLRVRPVAVQTDRAPAGQVVAVDPVGELSPGETVTVGYAAPPPTGKHHRHGHGKGHGKG